METKTPTNRAAWLPAKKVTPLVVGNAPYTPPGVGQLVVKNSAVAINPLDWIKQLIGDLLLPHCKYPFILGSDVAGTVVEVGPGVDRFRVGDRVVGNTAGYDKSAQTSAEGGFQLYTVLRDILTVPIPDGITYEQACVIPLGFTTVANAMFRPDAMGLDMPTVPARPPTGAGGKPRVVILTGGSTSLGSNAVQLGVAAGYEVISTASPKNHAYVKKLGATHVFDYRSPKLVDDMLRALKGRSLAGAMAIGDGAVEACSAVMRRHTGPTTKFIALIGGSPPEPKQFTSGLGITMFIGKMMWGMIKSMINSLFTGVKVKFVEPKDVCEKDSVVVKIYQEFLGQALASGQFVPAPEPLIVGKGIEKIQEAMEVQMKGVSAQKVVVQL